ncbi:MAG TPA: MFS transporter, partial [Lentzea sp.]
AGAALCGLLAYEPRRAEPLLELRFFRRVPFSGATVMAVAGFAALGSFLFLNTLYLQNVRGFSPLQAGLCTLPLAVMTVLFAPLSGRLVGARGTRPPLAVAGGAITVSGLLQAGLTPDTPIALLLASYVAFGIGFGMLNTPITSTAVAGMPNAQAGVAAAIASTSRQVGQTLGVAVAGFVTAGHGGWWIIAACGTMVLVLGFVTNAARWNPDATAAGEPAHPQSPSVL